MPKTQVVRIPEEATAQLNEIGKNVGASQAQLVRWAIDALIADVAQRGGTMVLPYRYAETEGSLQGLPSPVANKLPKKYSAK